MRKYFTIICFLTTLHCAAQEVTFFSPEVEMGVRQHLNIAESAIISMSQLDTITSLDLSHRAISDLCDLTMMPRLRILDLSDNQFNDLQPLALLDSLERLDLRFNNLRGINQLFYTRAKKLTINVGFNHIRDFSLFWTMSLCNFTLEGTGLQLDENEPFFDIFYFYADADGDVPAVCYHGKTNMDKEASLDCGSLHQMATMDGDSYKVGLTDSIGVTTMATLSNGEYGDTTWVVPQKVFDIRAKQEISFDTQLPETYSIGYANANVGIVMVEGTTLRYLAPDTESNDVVYFSYYEGNRVKGYSQLFMSNPEDTGLRSIVADNVFVELHDNRLSVRLSPVKVDERIMVNVVDPTGQQIVNHQSTATTDHYFEEFVLPEIPGRMIIVQVSNGDVRYIKKLSNIKKPGI